MKIALLGDIALIGVYDLKTGSPVKKKVEYIHSLTADCDIVLANLESPFTSKKHTVACKGVYLKSDPQNVEILKYMNVTHVTLANNHIYDYGAVGVRETIKTLEKNGIKYVGLGGSPVIEEVGNSKIAIEGFCCFSANGLQYGHKKNKVNTMDTPAIYSFLNYAVSENALPIISAHFGIEGLHYPAEEHVQMFHEMADKHSFILHGNHPHAIQGYEKYHNSYLFYALSDLCFGDCEVTSTHEVVKQHNCCSYIPVLTIDQNIFTDIELHGVSDEDDGIIKENTEVINKVFALSSSISYNEEYILSRHNEICNMRIKQRKRDRAFYIHRLNIRYLMAYFYSKCNARKYNAIFNRYLNKN